MNVVVCIKHVPDPLEPRRLDPATGELAREEVQGVIGPMDDEALEVALRWKDHDPDLQVTVLTMGPESARDSLRRALAKGADRAVHVEDPALAGSDYLGCARVLARAVERLEAAVVLCGERSADAEASLTGPAVAELLGWPQIAFVHRASLEAPHVVAEREWDGGLETLRAPLPVVLTVGRLGAAPRPMSFRGIMGTARKELAVWSLEELGIAAAEVGRAGARTRVLDVTRAPGRAARRVIEGEPVAVARELATWLHGG